MFEYSDKEFISREITFLECIHDEDKQKVLKSLEQISQTDQEKYEFDPYRIKTKNGKTIWVQDITNIIKDEKGNVTHYYCYITDITKQMEKNHRFLLNQIRTQLNKRFGKKSVN